MDMTFKNAKIKSCVRAISSKSEAHRALICAALADAPCFIICRDTNDDINATVSCLCALGANIQRLDEGFLVSPIQSVAQNAELCVGESGSTLRFLLPVAAALSAHCSFLMRGRLSQRPILPIHNLLTSKGVSLSPVGSNPVSLKGKLSCGEYCIAADVSSQYISGLLLALSVCRGTSTLTLSGKVESEPYISMTLDTLTAFGADISFDKSTSTYTVNGRDRLVSPSTVCVGGDWSCAAPILCAGAIGKNAVTVRGLELDSSQGDRQIIDILGRMGARIEWIEDKVTVYPSRLCGITLDARDIPDLVPTICVAAAVAQGKTEIFGASRLRFKESDRLQTTCDVLSALGADITPTSDGMIICGKPRLFGGEVDSFSDHRIAMCAAIASLVCDGEVTVRGFEAISKSYPDFLQNFE